MKKNLLLLVILFLSSLQMFGQKLKGEQTISKISEFESHLILSTSNDPIVSYKLKTYKRDELKSMQLVETKFIKKNSLKSSIVEGETKIDTTHTYPWNASSQTWDTIPSAQMISYYDVQHNLIQYVIYTWNSETSSWLESSQYLYTYNSSNQLLSVTEQASIFDGDSNYFWIDLYSSVYEYNSSGQETKYIYRFFNYDTYDWEASWQQEFFYDSQGNNILTSESYWDAAVSQWTPGLNVVNKYDEINHLILSPIQYWDANSSSWVNSYQFVYEYNSLGNKISKRIQKWNTDLGNWDNYSLETFTYNESNKVDNYLVQMWDVNLLKWIDSQRGIYKYDPSGNNTCILGETYNPYRDSWNASWVKYYDYNDQNKQISFESLYWDSGMGIWASGSQTKSLKINTFKQNNNKQDITKTLEVYPNPAKDYIYIQSSAAVNQIQLFDVSGNKVAIKNYSDLNNIQVDISSLTSGIYFLMVKDTNGNQYTKKLIKQ